MAENNQGNKGNNQGRTSNRGFASMDRQKQREIASKGGQAVSGNREHMAAIGRRGGEASGESRRNQNNNSGNSALDREQADKSHDSER